MKFLDQVYFDNSVLSYLVVAATIIITLFLKRIISRYISSLLLKIVKKKTDRFYKIRFDELIIGPVERILLALIIILSLDKLTFPKVLIFTIHKITSQDIVDGISSAIIIICFVALVVRFMDFLVLLIKDKTSTGKTSPGQHQLLFFFKDLIKVIIIIIGIVIILQVSFKINIGNLITGLSIVGAALALSARESLENLIASFIIFFDKPFEAGDFVKVNNYSGTVERIGLRSTRVRTAEKSVITVPNKQMVDSILDNWSMRDLIRNEIKTYLSPNTSYDDIVKVVEGIREIIQAKKEDLQNISVFLQEINNENAIVVAVYFTKFPMALDDLNSLKEEFTLAIKRLQEKHEIKPSAPTNVKLVN